MARNPYLREKRNKKIIAQLNTLQKNKSPKGHVIYSNEYINELLSEEFDLSEFTIKQVIQEHYRKEKSK